ncbi:MAG: hypothetical protein NTV81_01985 [Candidatus Komeilibacteria bacterium]|nr:hypothetical protein [Candidatus Komeilibacteria bacterium]
MMWKCIALVASGSIDLLVGFWVFSKNYKSRLRLSFLLLTVTLFIWCFANGLQEYYTFLHQLPQALFWFRMTYVAALLITPTLVYFSYYAPLELPLDTRLRRFLWIPILLAVFLLINPNFIITGVQVAPWGLDATYNIFGYTIFSLCLLFFMGLAFFILIKRYLFSDGVIKKALGYILFGLSLGSAFGVVFDLILPSGGYWKLNSFGAIFTLFLVFSIVYLILHKER